MTSRLSFQVHFPVLICAILSILAAPVGAQELRGKVQGLVADPSAAVIAGAKVTLRNDNTGVEVNRTTNQSGRYLFDFVSPGTYTLTIELEGFRTFVQRNILVETRADVTVNARLEIGAVTEAMTVTEAPVTVKFNSTTMETTIDTKMSNSLPIIHRNPFLLLALDPQVVLPPTTDGLSPYYSFSANRLDVGGGTDLNNEVLVDGVPNTWGMKTNYTPPMDSVSELNIQQNATDAEYGHSAGGTVSVQMKSGSNEWHGTAYYFGRNPKLNAVADSITHSPSVIRHNVWGGTLGNPIVKNKVFNYISYEGQNLREPRTLRRTMPTSLERQGDFSQSRNANGGLRQIFDPFTTVFNQATNTSTRMPFANNVIPKSMMDPVSLRILQDIWEPNGPGDDITGVNNFQLTYPNTFKYYNINNRTDWNINDNWKMFGRFSRFHTIESAPDVTGSPAQSTGGSARHGLQASADAVWTINASTVFNIRGSFNKPVDDFEDEQSKIQSVDDLWLGNKWHEPYRAELPKLFYPGVRVGSSDFGRRSFWYGEPKFWNFSSKISKQTGRHYIKVGGEYRGIHMEQGAFAPIDFRFGAEDTADTFINPNTKLRGDAWAAMLLGVIDNASSVQVRPLNEGRNSFYSLYVQDDFKLSQKITLNLGLRWEYDSPIGDARNRLSRYLDLTDPIPEFQGAGAPQLPAEATALRSAPPIWNGAWLFTDSAHPDAYHTPRFALFPRAGLAFRVNDHTALRVGYARYGIPNTINNRGGINILNRVPYPGFDNVSHPLPMLEGVPQSKLSDPFPAGTNPLIIPAGKSLGRYTQLGSTDQTLWAFQDSKNAVNDRISVSLQRQTAGQFVVDLTYFVSIGTNHFYQRNLNMYDPRTRYEQKSAVNKKVANPFFGTLTSGTFPGAKRNQTSVAVSDLLTPYPQYGQLTEQSTPGLRRRYQAFQVKVQRPFANGFNLLAGYAYNRARNDEFFDDIAEFDQRLELQDSDNPRQKFNVAAIFDLPFGKGRSHMSHAHPIAEAVLGGWTASSIYQYVGGAFLRFGAMQVNDDPALDHPTRDKMFKTEVFSRQPDFTPRTNPKQFSGVHGPMFSNLDVTLAKTVPLSERLGLEIRMESYNVTNSFMGGTVNLNVNSSLFGRVTAQRGNQFGRQFQYTARLRW